jgi:hypothetical protein
VSDVEEMDASDSPSNKKTGDSKKHDTSHTTEEPEEESEEEEIEVEEVKSARESRLFTSFFLSSKMTTFVQSATSI